MPTPPPRSAARAVAEGRTRRPRKRHGRVEKIGRFGRIAEAGRCDRLDALRGAAVVWMAAFHFAFDLSHFGYTRQNFYADPFWTLQRTCIVTLFLTCSGVAQAVVLERARAGPDGRFWRRWAQIAGCALLVSLGSWWMFPRSFISFGVLHCVAVGLLLTRAVYRALPGPAGPGFALLGGLALVAPLLFRHPWFDSRWTDWIGLVTTKPITEDYVPLLPWLGVLWLGVAGGRWLLARRPGWLAGPLPGSARPLAVLGRWSLFVYMVHQPVLIGALGGFVWLRGG